MNVDVDMTLDEAVAEVFTILTGMDLQNSPDQNRYRVITRYLNKALRSVALDQEWSHYSTYVNIGQSVKGTREMMLPSMRRIRILDDDSVRLVDENQQPLVWAYFLPRDALHKYAHRPGLWCSVTRRTLSFSRALGRDEDGLTVMIPVMREPMMFELPPTGEEVPAHVRDQTVDFPYPDLVIARAAALYAAADPVLQPRAMALEESSKNLMYQLIERDVAKSDNIYINEFLVPVENGLYAEFPRRHLHPHA